MAITRRGFLGGVLATAGTLLIGGRAGAEGDPPPPAASGGRSGGRQPGYLQLEQQGRLAERAEQARAMLQRCELCPRRCGVNRLRGETGVCGTADKAVVYSFQPHFGEEIPLVGRHGSGTIFFSNCNLRCVFCQNWPIAHEGRGSVVDDRRLAEIMLNVQQMGCPNINLVTPTHIMPNIVQATRIAAENGLRIPLCYNTGGYDSLAAIKLLDGIVDIYLPDLKFMDGAEAERYAGGAPDYPATARQAIAEMHRQVGDLITDERGVALRGLMVRHLVMPNRVAGTREFVHWVANTLSPSTYVNIMSQYRVEHRAFEYPQIARAITANEFLEAMEWADQAGLTNLDQRSVMQRELFRRRVG